MPHKHTSLAPRRSRLRIFVTALLIPLAVVIAIYVWTSWRGSEARKAYDARIDGLRAAGDPVTPAEVAAAGAFPDEQNAAIPLRRAAALTPSLDEPTWRKFDPWSFVPPLSQTEKELAGLFAVNVDRIDAELRDAASRPQANWNLKFERRMIDTHYPDLNQQRELANGISYMMRLEMDRGDTVAAFRRLPQLWTVARAMWAHPTTLGVLVASGLEALTLARAEEVLPRLKIGNSPDSVPADEVRRFMTALADEQTVRQSFRRAFHGDRIQFLEVWEAIASGETLAEGGEPTTFHRAKLHIMRPELHSGMEIAVDVFSAMILAIDASDWPASEVLFPDSDKLNRTPSLVPKTLSLTVPSLQRVARVQYETLARRRLARTAIAMRLYAADHEGHFPKRLDELVPAYLPEIPADAFAAGGSLIKYKPGTDPLLYSVGKDGVDDGGTELVQDPESLEYLLNRKPSKNREAGDLLFRLTIQPRPPEPKPQGDPADE